MASSHVEFASCLLNRPSTSTTSTSTSASFKKNIKGALHPCITSTNSPADSSWLPSENSKIQSNVDLSWLPNHNDNGFASKSDDSHQQNGQIDFDDSWLPNYCDTKRKSSSTTASKPNASNRSRKTENDSRVSSTQVVKNGNKNKGQDDSWLPAYNDTKKNSSTTALKSSKSYRSRKTENDSDNSWISSTHIVKNGNRNKEISSSNNKLKKSRSQDHSEVVISGDQQIQHAKVLNKKSESSRSRQVSPSKSECSVETDSLGGVSTLLRRWKDLAETKNFNRKADDSSGSNHSKSGSESTKSNGNNPQGNPQRVSDSKYEDSSVGSESCKTNPTRPLPRPTSSRGTKDSKAINAEKEKLRVVDIVRKLSSEEESIASQAAGHTNESSTRTCKPSDHQQVAECFSPVIGSPRLIRGSQAFKDFLILTEHDKRLELESLARRKPVTQFSHRGRIQASLRVRFIRLGAEAKTDAKIRRHSVSKTTILNSHDISDPRDRSSTGVNQGTAASRKKNNNGEERKSHAGPISEVEVNLTTNSQEVESSTTSNQLTKMATSVGCCPVREVEGNAITTTTTTTTITATNSQELESVTTSNQEAEDHHQITELTCPSKEVMDKAQDINSSSHSLQSKEDTHSEIQVPDRENYHEQNQFISAKMFSSGTDDKGLDGAIQAQNDVGDHSSHRQALLENCHHWISEYSDQIQSDWDEEESYELFHVDHDWISDISRPRSDWESMRQARYQEMLDLYSYNEDIRNLLERRSVTNFLSSRLRDMIERLLMSRTHGCSYPEICSKDGKQEAAGRESRREEAMEEEKYEDDDSMVDENEDGGSRIKRQCSEDNEFIDQTTCSSTPALEERSWVHPNAIYDHDQTASPSPWHNTPQSSSFINHPSIEMELICDLRGHLVQLQQEIMEVKKSITSCVDMQVKMQSSIKQNVAAAVAQSVEKWRREGESTKRKCCVCYATQVDSFLYRCGHMCTCFDCSMELQSNSGKCPVCEAPILDVVRAYGDQ